MPGSTSVCGAWCAQHLSCMRQQAARDSCARADQQPGQHLLTPPRLWGAAEARGWWVCALMDGQLAGGDSPQTSSLLGAADRAPVVPGSARTNTRPPSFGCLSELRATATTSSSTMQCYARWHSKPLSRRAPPITELQAKAQQAAGRHTPTWPGLRPPVCGTAGAAIAAWQQMQASRSTAAARDALGCQPANTVILPKEREPHGTPACTEAK